MITNPFPVGSPMWHTFEKLDKNDPNLQKPPSPLDKGLDIIGSALGMSKPTPTPQPIQPIAPTIQPMQGNLQVARISNEPEQSFFERNKKPLLIGTVVLITIIVIMVVVAKQTKKTK